MGRSIDLNSDLGESFGPWVMGNDPEMLSIVTSANIACGGHASDPETMFKTLTLAHENNVVVGAHPGYNDREGFGRRIIPMEPDEIGRMVVAQIGAISSIAALAGIPISYVKPHGALGNLAASDESVAEAIVRHVARSHPEIAFLAISGNCLEAAAKSQNREVYSEIFADRGYLSSGQLVPREQPGAMVHGAEDAAERLIGFLKTGLMPVIDGDPIALDADSICIHGDSPTAVSMAKEVRHRLLSADIDVSPFITI